MSFYDEIRVILLRERELAKDTIEEPATDKQINLLAVLLKEEHEPRNDEDMRFIKEDRPGDPLTKRSASAEISTLKRTA